MLLRMRGRLYVYKSVTDYIKKTILLWSVPKLPITGIPAGRVKVLVTGIPAVMG